MSENTVITHFAILSAPDAKRFAHLDPLGQQGEHRVIAAGEEYGVTEAARQFVEKYGGQIRVVAVTRIALARAVFNEVYVRSARD